MRLRTACGPLAPVLLFAAVLFGLLSCSRLALALAWQARVLAEDGWVRLFLVGLRMDAVLVGMVIMLPTVLCLSLPAAAWSKLRRPFVIYATAILVSVLFMELAAWQFLDEYERRPDRLFWEYLNRPREVLTTVVKTGWPSLAAAAVLLPLAAWGAWRLLASAWPAAPGWRLWVRLAVLPLCAGVIFLGIRGTGHRPLNPSSAAFTDENLLNQLALNSTYTAAYALYALYREEDAGSIYGRMDRAEVLARWRAAAHLPPEAEDPAIPTLRRVATTAPRQRPLNLIVILEESMGAPFVGHLGGLPLTPNLDALAAEATSFSNLYATGDRTVRGIEAVIAGFPPSPSLSVVKLGLSQSGFCTAATVLGGKGYETVFYYGGESNFDDMRSFLQGNGFSRFVDQPQFTNPSFAGTWGVSDEDLMRKAVADMATIGDKPFFAFILSTSNHPPFEYPAGAIEPYEQPLATRNNTVKYADHAIGVFLRLAREQAFWKDTVVLICADHNLRTTGQDIVPVAAFRIPAVITGPGFPAQRIARLSSQIDLLPTILPRLGLDLSHPFIGRDVFALPDDDPGRAVMQFGDSHVYLRGDRAVVHLPKADPRIYRYADGHLVPADGDWGELRREARAHALLPGILYRERTYRLP